MQKVIIITGGIASGKSYILKILQELGYPIMQSDKVAHDLMKQDWFLNKMKHILDKSNFNIKEEIENDPRILNIIERIIYPEIAIVRQQFIDYAHKKNLLPVIETPLFFEQNISRTLLQYKLYIISTICGKELQIQRAKSRKQPISNKILDILLMKQIDDKERLVKSNFVIYTFLDKSVVKKQLMTILNSIE